MKKVLAVGVCALLLVVLTGCGKNKVTCTGSSSEGGINIEAKVVAELDKDNKVSDVTVEYDLGSKETADTYCSLFKLMEDEESGVTVSCSGSKITIKGMAGLDDDSEVIGLTKDEFVKQAQEEAGLTCK